MPTRRGRYQVEAPSPGRPRLVQMAAKRASEEAYRTSHIMVSPKPQPTATPLMAPMTGLSHFWIMREMSRSGWGRRQGAASASSPDSARRAWLLVSAPEQNPRPAPVMTTQRVSRSSCKSMKVCARVCLISALSALSFSGRLRVILRIAPSRSTRTSDMLSSFSLCTCLYRWRVVSCFLCVWPMVWAIVTREAGGGERGEGIIPSPPGGEGEVWGLFSLWAVGGGGGGGGWYFWV